MKQIYMIALLSVLVAGCQMRETPKDYAAVLDTKDSKFNSAACKEMREKSQAYEISYAGPIAAGLIIAAPLGGLMMMSEDQKRYKFLNELHDACSKKQRPDSWDWPERKKQ